MKERIYLSYQFESDNSNESDITMAESFEEGATIQQVLTLVEKFMHSCGYQFDGDLIIDETMVQKEAGPFHGELRTYREETASGDIYEVDKTYDSKSKKWVYLESSKPRLVCKKVWVDNG